MDNYKAQEIIDIDTSGLNDLVDWMVFASGSSARQIKALTDNLVTELKKQNILIIGTEGKDNAKWSLVDLGEVVVHIMRQDVREYYQLEKLWSTTKEQSGSL